LLVYIHIDTPELWFLPQRKREKLPSKIILLKDVQKNYSRLFRELKLSGRNTKQFNFKPASINEHHRPALRLNHGRPIPET
jgi:hypothetical protein